MAEEAVLVEGSSFMDPFKGLLLTYFMPESCYDEFFLDFNFLDGEWLDKSSFPVPRRPKRHLAQRVVNQL